jgi:hypothetical protein
MGTEGKGHSTALNKLSHNPAMLESRGAVLAPTIANSDVSCVLSCSTSRSRSENFAGLMFIGRYLSIHFAHVSMGIPAGAVNVPMIVDALLAFTALSALRFLHEGERWSDVEQGAPG